MICIYAESHLCTFTFIFYTCIWIPLLQTVQSILTIFSCFIHPNHHHHENTHLQEPQESPARGLDLRVSRFRSIENRGGEGEDDENEEMCPICLMVFEKQDLVNKLPRCGHKFHMECMKKWLDRCQFTCPLCRSLVLPCNSTPCEMSASASCIRPSSADGF